MQYSLGTTILKGVFGAGASGTVAVLALWAYNGFATSDWTVTPEVSIAIAAAAAATWAAVKNWSKNYLGPKMDRIKLIKMLAIGGACGLFIGAQGCVTAGAGKGHLDDPAIMNTTIETQQAPQVDPVSGALIPGERYYAKIEKSLPAGTDLEGQDNLHFGIGLEGNWDVTLGQNAGYSSQGQMQGLLEYAKVNAQLQQQQQAQAWGSIMPFLSLIAPDAAALIGKRMDLGAADKARDDANSAARDAQILKFLDDLSKRIGKLEKPATPPADAPLELTLPEVAP